MFLRGGRTWLRNVTRHRLRRRSGASRRPYQLFLCCALDCIDDIDTKTALLHYCVKNGVPIVSCMAASTRLDPAHLCVGDISETKVDPLSRAVCFRSVA